MSAKIKIDMKEVLNNLNKLSETALIKTSIYANTAAATMVSYAKANAPWTDRTGNSRQTIDYNVGNTKETTSIELRGNTPHFKYLELCHEKKNAILMPTVKNKANEVAKGWGKALGL